MGVPYIGIQAAKDQGGESWMASPQIKQLLDI